MSSLSKSSIRKPLAATWPVIAVFHFLPNVAVAEGVVAEAYNDIIRDYVTAGVILFALILCIQFYLIRRAGRERLKRHADRLGTRAELSVSDTDTEPSIINAKRLRANE